MSDLKKRRCPPLLRFDEIKPSVSKYLKAKTATPVRRDKAPIEISVKVGINIFLELKLD